MAPPLPVYVVHWNAPAWARSTTDSLLASTIETAITVVDNGPYDGRLQLDPRVSIVPTGTNLGYAGGANLGIARWLASESELCIVACHDVTLDADALERLVAAAGRHPRHGILAPEPGANVVSGPPAPDAADNADHGDTRDVTWASGTCLLLRRSCISEIGGFDETFVSYGEDVDLCYRVWAAGWRVALVRGTHASGAGSVDASFRTQMYVNQVRLRAKHAGRGAATRLVAAFPFVAAADASRWIVRRDPVLLARSASRLRALPRAALAVRTGDRRLDDR